MQSMPDPLPQYDHTWRIPSIVEGGLEEDQLLNKHFHGAAYGEIYLPTYLPHMHVRSLHTYSVHIRCIRLTLVPSGGLNTRSTEICRHKHAVTEPVCTYVVLAGFFWG